MVERRRDGVNAGELVPAFLGEMARFVAAALDITMRAARSLVEHDDDVRLLLVRVKPTVLREALSTWSIAGT